MSWCSCCGATSEVIGYMKKNRAVEEGYRYRGKKGEHQEKRI
jgi:hypothetical protein